MAGIEDVARLAGVSRMTVSRVINNNGYIKAETRQRVEAAIAQLNYRPNMLAKALVTKRSRTIAYIMLNVSDPFHNMIIRGLESVAYHSQYTTVICDAHSAHRERDYMNMFMENRIGGAIIHHLNITEEQIRELMANGVKCVLMDNEENIPGVSSVNSDNYAGGKMAAEYLLSKGHRRIGCVHAPLEMPTDDDIPYENTFQFNIWKQRTQGFVDGLAAQGVECAGFFKTKVRFDYAEPTMPGIVDKILAMPNRPTALYCEDDIMALGVINELWTRGLKVPEDLAIIGHDGLDLCHMMRPNLTTIAQPRYEMGKRACEMLIEQIEKSVKAETITLQPTLWEGETA